MTGSSVAAAAKPLVLSPSVREFVNRQANRIRYFAKEATENITLIGEALHATKQRLGHGQWLSWLEHEFQWSDRHARTMISVYEWAKCKSENFSNLSIDMSALYLLARQSTPEAARDAAVELAKSGERVTHAKAKELIAAARPIEINRAAPATRPARRSREAVAADKAVKEREARVLVLTFELQGMAARLQEQDAASTAQDMLAMASPRQLREFVDTLPLVIAQLAALKAEMQRIGLLKPASFGFGKPVLMKGGPR